MSSTTQSPITVASGRVSKEKRYSTEPREYYALLQIDGVDTEVHRFWIPHWTKPGGQRAHFSLSMFNDRESHRFFDVDMSADPLKPHYYAHVEWIEECRVEVDPSLPTHNHATLWDMYEAIGYDIKKKRFVGKEALESVRKKEEGESLGA
jgi:hypothetical protein